MSEADTGQPEKIVILFAGEETNAAWAAIEPAFRTLVDAPVKVVPNQETTSWDEVTAQVLSAAAFAAMPVERVTRVPKDVPTVVVDLNGEGRLSEQEIEEPSVLYLHSEMPAGELRRVLAEHLRAHDTLFEGTRDDIPKLVSPIADTPEAYPTGPSSIRDQAELATITFEQGPIATVVAEAESGTILAVNNAAVGLFGRSHTSLRGADTEELYPHDKPNPHVANAESGTRQDTTAVSPRGDGLLEVSGGDGKQIPVSTDSETVRLGDSTYLIRTFARAEEAHERITTLQQQVTAMDASLTGISILDETGEYVYMNDAHADILGYAPKMLLGGSWRQLYDEQTIAHVESDVFPHIVETGGWEGELVGRDPTNKPVDQHVSLTSLPDGGLICVNRDISHQKRLEQQLRAIRGRVETFMLADTATEVVEELLAASVEVLERPQVGYWASKGRPDRLEPVRVRGHTESMNVEIPTFERGEGLIWGAYEAKELRYYPDVKSQYEIYNAESPIASEVIIPVGEHGVMMVGSEQQDDFEPTELELVQILSSHAKTALTLIERETQLIAAQDTIETERDQLRTIIDQIPHLIFAKTGKGEFIIANEAAAKAYGTTTDCLESWTEADLAGQEVEAEQLYADDQRVFENKKTVQQQEDTITDASGTERIVNTVKMPLELPDNDERAMLSVATDVTESHRSQVAYERQRKLTGLNRIGRLLLDTTSEKAMAETGVAVTAETLGATQVSFYRFEAEHGRLVRKATARENGISSGPATITPNDNDLWSAFASRETRQEMVAPEAIDSGQETAMSRSKNRSMNSYQRIMVPLDEFGLLTVVLAADISPDMEFIETAARTVTAAIKRISQKNQLTQLHRKLTKTDDTLRESQALAEAFQTATRRLREASDESAVYQALAGFGETVGDEVWIGHWHAGSRHIDPVFDTSANGLARPQGETKSVSTTTVTTSPMLTAIQTDEPETVHNTLADEKYETWTDRLVRFGYQSIIAVPISCGPLVHGAIEVVHRAPEAFESGVRRALVELCRTAAERFESMEDTPDLGQQAEFDFELTTERLCFPELPDGWLISGTELFFTSREMLRVEGTLDGATHDAAESYFQNQPHFAGATIVDNGPETLSLTVDILGATETIESLWRVADAQNLTLITVTADHQSEVISLRAPSNQIRTVKLAIDDLVEDVALVTKRVGPTNASTGGQSSPLDELTDRQREIIATAYRLGFYAQPKDISGDELAERFGISRSTVHQHLRKAEGTLLKSLLED
jgi:PAS domain S-box-containing protein